MSKKIKILLITVAVILFVIGLFPIAAMMLFEAFWWQSVGYFSVLVKMILIKGLAFLLPALFTMAAIYGWMFGVRKTEKNPVLLTLIILAGVGAGIWGIWNWELFIWNLAEVSKLGYRDPIFHLDAYFYVIRLPFLRTFVLMLAVECGALFLIDFFLKRRSEKPVFDEGKIVLDIYSSLLFLALFLTAGFYLLSYLFELLVIQPYPKLGVGYSIVYGEMLGRAIFLAIGLIFVILTMIKGMRGVKLGFVLIAAITMTAVYFLAVKALPELIENYIVKPNELIVQKPLIEKRIEATRNGFSLFTEELPALSQTNALLTNLIRKVRIWDTDPYKSVIKQFQEIKSYYEFNDVDVDRYTVLGEEIQTVIAVRELEINNLPPDAMNWNNIHLRYTHGNGAVLSPANAVSETGTPVFWLRNLENTAEYSNFVLKNPQIYFGELTSNYIFVRTGAGELDYETNTNVYLLDKGVPIDPLLQRLVYSFVLGEKMILFTQYFNENSRILYRRQIQERIRTIFPYFRYDGDPYPFIANGKLYWMIDAYTVSPRYPFAERFETEFGNINYIRNSAKVVVDAYSGDVFFYAIDTSDPLLNAYRFVFPELFKDKIPPEFEKHFRAPVSLFKIQAQVMCNYHENDPSSFYNRENIWRIPEQIYGTNKAPFQPYYVTMSIGGKSRFCLIEPFNPANKENLAGSMIATFEDGKVKLYSTKLKANASSLGPMQVEAMINQDESLSRLFTLWSQKGSSIFRGNIQFIPIDNTMVYVKSVFLASVQTSIPTLAKIIAIIDGKVFFGSTMNELVNNIQNNLTTLQIGGTQAENMIGYNIEQAYQMYLKAEAFRIEGNEQSYRETVDSIGALLKKTLSLMEAK